MRTTTPMLPVLAASFVAMIASGVAGCSSATSDPATGASSGTPSGTSGGTTPAPKVPPKGDPADPAPVDPTNDPSLGPCTGAAGELYALSPVGLTGGTPVPLCKFAGSVLMIVNVASSCGYTPQYAPLQALYTKYRAQGFYVLGFPSKSFNQELETGADVSSFCTTEYGITFPMFDIGDVNGAAQQPVYTWLKGQPGYEADIPWNFEKWIVDRHGKVAKRIVYTKSPDSPDVVAAIEAELAKK